MQISPERAAKLAQFKREMYRDNSSPDIEQIAGLYPRGYLSIVASAAGTGKTWLMQYISCQLSTGGVILGGLTRSRPMKVVIMSGETGNELLNKRLGKTNWPHRPENISVYSAIDMGMAEVSCNIAEPDGRNNIITIIANEKPDIVFFDTLISFHTMDESKQGDMTRIYMFCCRLAKVFNCAVVCNHHTRKRPADNPNREQNQDDVIGTSAGVRLANAVYVVSAVDEGEGMTKMTVRNVKNWDKKIPPFSYKFTETDGYTDFIISHKVAQDWSMKKIIGEYVKDLMPGAYLDPKTLADMLHVDTTLTRYYLDNFCNKGGQLRRVKILGEYKYKRQYDDGTGTLYSDEPNEYPRQDVNDVDFSQLDTAHNADENITRDEE